jgi:hypothetical protein
MFFEVHLLMSFFGSFSSVGRIYRTLILLAFHKSLELIQIFLKLLLVL